MAVRRAKLAWVLVAVAALGAACKPKKEPAVGGNDDQSIAEDGTDASAAETDAELLASSLVASSPSGQLGLASVTDLDGADISGAGIGDGVRAIYFPRGCVDVAPDLANKTATYTFRGCLGPNGLFGITGEVKVTYRDTPTSLHLELVATDLVVNKAKVDWAASADITANGVDRSMTWKAELSGTTARGREFSRSNEKNVAWKLGEPCYALSGFSQGDVRGRDLRVEIRDFRRCRGECPDAGGVISVTNVATGARIEVRYDGTNKAKVIGSNGASLSLQLACRA